MQRLYQRLQPRGLRIVAVSIDAAPGNVDADGRPGGDVIGFAREFHLTFDIWQDPGGAVARLDAQGRVHEIRDPAERHAHIARDYVR